MINPPQVAAHRAATICSTEEPCAILSDFGQPSRHEASNASARCRGLKLGYALG